MKFFSAPTSICSHRFSLCRNDSRRCTSRGDGVSAYGGCSFRAIVVTRRRCRRPRVCACLPFFCRQARRLLFSSSFADSRRCRFSTRNRLWFGRTFVEVLRSRSLHIFAAHTASPSLLAFIQLLFRLSFRLSLSLSVSALGSLPPSARTHRCGSISVCEGKQEADGWRRNLVSAMLVHHNCVPFSSEQPMNTSDRTESGPRAERQPN